MGQQITILTRGSHDFGMGHLHRSLWMREVLLGCGRDLSVHLCCLPGARAEEYFAERGVKVHVEDWLSRPQYLPEADLLLIDWLDGTPGSVARLRPRFPRIMLLDDYGPATAEADLVVRCLLSSIASSRLREGRAEVCSGIQYLQLAPSILKIRYGAQASLHALEASLVDASERLPGPVHSIMLSFGGTPRPLQTGFMLGILAEMEFAGRIIVKPADLDMPIPSGLDVECHADARDFHTLLSACDACVVGGGLTLYEALFLGVAPMVLPVVDHQLETARKLNAAGCCLIGGKAGELNPNLATGRLLELLGGPSQRGRLIHNGMRLVDGRGIYRTLDVLLKLLDSPPVP